MFYLYGFHPDIAQSYQRYLSRFSNHITICDDWPETSVTKQDTLIVDADNILQHAPSSCLTSSHIFAIGNRPIAAASAPNIRYFAKPISLPHVGLAILESTLPELETLFPVAEGWQLAMPRKILIHSETKRSIVLTDKEGELLAMLLQASPNTISKDDLLQQIWGYGEHLDTHTLETHIYRLRTKLSDILTNEKGLITYADGYGFAR